MSAPQFERFQDRAAAGAMLAKTVGALRDRFVDPIVIALPRGGVPVAMPIAETLDAPLGIVVVRKIGVPMQREFALGAVDEDANAVIDHELALALRLSDDEVDQLTREAFGEVLQRAKRLRGSRDSLEYNGRDVVLVDDGCATGMTAIAAARYVQRHGARRTILAVPVAPESFLESPPEDFDMIICPHPSRNFHAVSLYYDRFGQVSDDAVRKLLRTIS